MVNGSSNNVTDFAEPWLSADRGQKAAAPAEASVMLTAHRARGEQLWLLIGRFRMMCVRPPVARSRRAGSHMSKS